MCGREWEEGAGAVPFSRERGVAVGEDDTDGWAPSVRERGTEVSGLGWFGCWANSVLGRPRLPLFFIFFFFFLFLFFCFVCLKTFLFGFG
jgi:hypothetical protein